MAKAASAAAKNQHINSESGGIMAWRNKHQ